MKYLVMMGLLIGFLIALIMIPSIIKVSFRKGFLDKPNERKIHQTNIPRLGGTSFFPVAMIVGALMVSLGYRFTTTKILTEVFHYSGIKILFAVVGMMVLFCIGLLDDLWGLRYRTKFLGQIMAGLLLCLGGVWLQNLWGMFGLHEVSPWLGWPITIFAIVFVTNAINFIDGIDGLAASVCFCTLTYYCVLAYDYRAYDYAIVAVSMMGPLLAFLLFNVFGSAKRHTKTFMGDTGSLCLGFLICALGIVVSQLVGKHGEPDHYRFLSDLNPMAVAFAPLLLPCFDVMRVVLVRHRQGKNPFDADKNHIHHKFLSLGLSQHATLLLVVALTALFCVVAVALTAWIDVNLVLLIMLVLWTALNLWIKNNNYPLRNDNKNKA